MIRILDKYRIDMAALSEARILQFRTLEYDNYHVLYSGNERVKASGVALASSGTAKKYLLDWKPINDRILRARFSTTQAKRTVIPVYVPTNGSSDSDKNIFHRSLSDVVNKVHSHDILVVCGDFNAKVGCNQDYAPTAIGSHGLGETSKNDVRLIDYCVINDMIVEGTWYPQKTILKYTWNSHDGTTRNQIEYILVSKHRRRSLEDVRPYCRADSFSEY